MEGSRTSKTHKNWGLFLLPRSECLRLSWNYSNSGNNSLIYYTVPLEHSVVRVQSHPAILNGQNPKNRSGTTWFSFGGNEFRIHRDSNGIANIPGLCPLHKGDLKSQLACALTRVDMHGRCAMQTFDPCVWALLARHDEDSYGDPGGGGEVTMHICASILNSHSNFQVLHSGNL